jgi:phage terminase large subunit GpA-like protein
MATAAPIDTTLHGLEDLYDLWAPSERRSLSQWAEEHFFLSQEYSAKTGLIVLDPWQRQIFDAFTDPAVEQLVVQASTQMIKTLLLQAAAAFVICEDPGPILMVSYKDTDAEKMSKERFSPMIRDIAPLRARVAPAKSRDASNTIEHKLFPGGTIDFVGSLSPANLARRTIRYLMADEIDKYERSAGKEGDPLALAIKRTARYGSRRKIILTCSPTEKGNSRIEEAYAESDQRKPYVACHKCGHPQILTWGNVQFDSDLPLDEAAASARYKCEGCGELWTDGERKTNIAGSVEFRPHAPFTGSAGFWISHLYSTLPLHSLGELTKEFLTAFRSHNTERQKVFINTSLAELWEQPGDRPDDEAVQALAEPYDVGPHAILPAPVIFLTAGVDVQANRLEVQVLGHTQDGHVLSVDYQVIELSERTGVRKETTHPDYWVELDRVLERRYRHPGGPELPLIAMAVDVGYNADPVYKFASNKPRPTYGPLGLEIHTPGTVICVRGYDSESYQAIHKVSEREAARSRKGFGKDVPIVTLGTGYIKTQLYSELLGAGDRRRVHTPTHYGREYYRGLVAEKRVVAEGDISWKKLYPRNEPLDTWCYAMGAFYAFRADRFNQQQWETLRRQMGFGPSGQAPVDRPKQTGRPKFVRNRYVES